MPDGMHSHPQGLRQAGPEKETYHVPGITQGVAQPVAEPLPQQQPGLSRSELEDSLRSIDDDHAADQPPAKKKRFGRKPKGERRSPTRKQILRRGIVVIVLAVLGVGGFMFAKGILASNAMFKGDIFGLVQQKALVQDANGRTNILVFGTSEDDEGGDHPGAYLTDSIMLLSVDQNKKDAYMVGIPRDLWVKYGEACQSGYEGKINALYQCYSDDGKNDEVGSKALMSKISEATGLEIQYFAHVNYSVVRDAVDAVGGVDVKIESSDPRGIYDPNFDWKCNHKCHMVDYKNGQNVHLDGEHALALARARNAEGGYGLPGGNFDRERNQQKILMALRVKALSAGTLANPVAVTQLIDAMGNNLRTNFQTSEIRTLMSLGSDMKPEAIHSISLDKDGELAVTTGNASGQSIVRAVSGLYDYSSIIKYIKKQINAEPFMLEDAKITVLNGSGVVGQARVAGDKLVDMGFTVNTVANAPAGSYAAREVYARDATSYAATRQKLQTLYGGTVKVGFEKFSNITADTDFVVVVGKAETTTTQ